jgi:hypothetical protein
MQLSMCHTGRDRRLLAAGFELANGFGWSDTGFIDAPNWIPGGSAVRYERVEWDGLKGIATARAGESAVHRLVV